MEPARHNESQYNSKLQWWIRFQLAASIIQRCYRSWHLRKYTRTRVHRRSLHLKLVAHKDRHTTNSLADSFREVINGNGSFEDSMVFWRSSTELRRAHSAHSTDLIIRAIIESQGDLSRSITLLGTREFVMNNQHSIPQKLRNIFLPEVSTFSHSAANPEYYLSALKRGTDGFSGNKKFGTMISSKDDRMVRSFESGLEGRRTGVNTIRSLRSHNRREKRKELFEILNATLAITYFSKHHSGKINTKQQQQLLHQQQKSPNKGPEHSRSRGIFEVAAEMNCTMDYLSSRPANLYR